MTDISKAEPGTGRKRFERWAKGMALDITQDYDGYTDPVTAGAWLVWRNARAADLQDTAEVKAQVLEEAFDSGFALCAREWAERDDLLCDMDSPRYKQDRAKRLREEG